MSESILRTLENVFFSVSDFLHSIIIEVYCATHAVCPLSSSFVYPENVEGCPEVLLAAFGSTSTIAQKLNGASRSTYARSSATMASSGSVGQ